MIDTPLPSEKPTANAVGEASGNGKTGLNKRQRTFTTSSGDTAPQARLAIWWKSLHKNIFILQEDSTQINNHKEGRSKW